MKIKDLKKILDQAPDENAEVCIPGNDGNDNDNIVYDFDDDGNLDLY